MSFMKPKIPAVPAAAAAPTEEEQIAKRVEMAHRANVDYSRARRASETNVGGRAIAYEAQAARGEASMERRTKAREDLYGR